MTPRSATPRLAAAILDALPAATLVVDRAFRIVHANAAARRALGARAGAALGDAFPCAGAAGRPCGAAAGCAGCAIRGAVSRALAGDPARARGFLVRTGGDGAPADLHLLASAAPFRRGRALLVLQDVDGVLRDPAVVRICAGCGRVEDGEGCWYPLHRFLEDRLGLSPDALCERCERGGPRGPPA